MSDRAPQPAGGSAAQPEHGTGSLRILILEDRITDVELMLFELRRAGFTPIHRHVDNALDYSENLSQDLDVILADYTLPQFDALEALRVLQERGLSVPFIVVTGSISEEAAVACMKSGATDYLLKDRLARLGPAIRQALASRGMREAKLRAEEQMRSRNRELSLLNRIIAASAKTGDEREFLQVACTETAGALGAFLAAAILLDEKTGTPVIAAEHSSVAGLSLRGKPFRETWISMGAMLAGLRVPAIANHITDSHPIAALHADFLEHPFRSMAVVPLVVDGSTVGGVGLFSDREGHFTEERATLLGSVADELSSVLSRTRLERDRMRLAAAVEQSADAIMIQDVDGVIGYVNTGFERMVGRPRAEIIGKPSSLLMDVRPDPGLVREIAESIRQGREWRGRMSTRRRDGCPCIADVSFSPVHDRSGRTVNFVMIARDVTEALRLEQRYLQAQKMEAIGRLAGGVAHDFNNLLTSIMGYADLLAERFPPETPAGGEVQQIQTAVERAAALTRQLLLFGRRQVLSPRVVNSSRKPRRSCSLCSGRASSSRRRSIRPSAACWRIPARSARW